MSDLVSIIAGMEREQILEEVTTIEAFLASFRCEEGETAFLTSMRCFRAKPLRSVCIRRGIRAQGKEFKGASTKTHYIAALWEHCRANGPSSPIPTDSTQQDIAPLSTSTHSLIRPTQSTTYDIFRLVNVLLSDAFSQRLSEMHQGADDRQFWEDVAASYRSNSLELDGLMSAHTRFRTLDPSIFELHPPTKLRDLWTNLCVAYEAAYERVLMTAKSSRVFSDVYQGRLDVLYLHEWLRIRPEHVSSIGIKWMEQQNTAVEHDSSPSDVSGSLSSSDSSSDSELETADKLSNDSSVADVETGEVSSVSDTQVDGFDAQDQRKTTEMESNLDTFQSITETQAEELQELSKAQTLKRKLELLENISDILHRDAPDETEIKRRRLKDASEYVQSLFRTVETMRSAGCSESEVAEMLREAQRQASKLVRESRSALP